MEEKLLRALIVEDSEDDALLLKRQLQSGGYKVVSQRVDTPDAMKAAIEQQSWDIVFADYTMPQFDGLSALRLLRETNSDMPFIFVSGTIGEDTAVMAMRAGAQDYIMKGRSKRLLPAVERELQEAETRRDRRQTEQARARLIATLEASMDFVGMADAQGRMFYLNRAGRNMLAFEPGEDISHLNLVDLSPAWSAGYLRDALALAHRDGVWYGECTLVTRTGSEISVSQQLLAHHDEHGAVEFYSAIARDMSERKRFEEELRHQATHDSLTGLPNRVLLQDRLEHALLTAQRHQLAVAVLFLDLDNFKRINDTLGHSAGDALLRQVGTRLRARLRTTDTVGRRGGDEFMVIFNHPFDVKEVMTVVNKVRGAFSQPFDCEGEELFVTATLGIALYPEDGQNAETLVKNADVAMYRAKDKGKDQYQFYIAEMSAESRAQLTMEMELRRALERSEFVLHYQPQLDTQSGRTVGFESLIRWQHPRRGLLQPDQFVPLLEESGLIVGVGEWVLRSACAQWRSWRAQGWGGLRVAVNVSARQFGSTDIVRLLRQVVQEEQVPPGCIELEVTETVVMQDVMRAAEILNALRRLGVRPAIDDFGTGYASLSYLKRFAIDILKIDQSFVFDADKHRDDAAIIEAITSLGHNLGMEVVAEGVETQGQFDFLRAQGCDTVQGYLLGRPMAVNEVDTYLKRVAVSRH